MVEAGAEDVTDLRCGASAISVLGNKLLRIKYCYRLLASEQNETPWASKMRQC